ncbi:MAG: diguanylate cyclase [Kofleriaceae bacterium]|nr:diguanylate cyclase [Myxococcales bacterium]MCB9562143.1 diguanylate cyclase [Kofleriaceae bacterium]
MSDWEEETSVTEQADVEPLIARDDGVQRAFLIVLAGGTVGEMFKVPDGEAMIGRSRKADVCLIDDGVSRMHCRILASGDQVWIEDLDSRNGTLINGDKVDGRAQLKDGDKIQVGRTTILKFTYHDSLEQSFQQQMYESALRDGLTKVYNKRYFAERMESEWRFAARHHADLAILFLDLDHFKLVNDRHGHLAGDAVLAAVAGALAHGVRNEDVVARYGGEEFALLLRATPPAAVRGTAERLRRTIEALAVVVGEETIRVTVSIGVACYPEVAAKTAEDLVAAADQALYRAKSDGRNRVSS